jgi:hypothetical protein
VWKHLFKPIKRPLQRRITLFYFIVFFLTNYDAGIDYNGQFEPYFAIKGLSRVLLTFDMQLQTPREVP